jgi:Bacterial low temperature requirement A protein (LtrA)
LIVIIGAVLSDDPGRLGRSAYHLIHPVMVAGIIVTAAADEKGLSDPGQPASAAAAWMILGGPALFLAGHAAFKLVVWRVVSWPRLAGVAGLALLALTVGAISALALAACAAVLVIAVAASDRLPWLPRPAGAAGYADNSPTLPVSVQLCRSCSRSRHLAVSAAHLGALGES